MTNSVKGSSCTINRKFIGRNDLPSMIRDLASDPTFWTGNCHSRRSEKLAFWTILGYFGHFWIFWTGNSVQNDEQVWNSKSSPCQGLRKSAKKHWTTCDWGIIKLAKSQEPVNIFLNWTIKISIHNQFRSSYLLYSQPLVTASRTSQYCQVHLMHIFMQQAMVSFPMEFLHHVLFTIQECIRVERIYPKKSNIHTKECQKKNKIL